jgi:hypothetical protein
MDMFVEAGIFAPVSLVLCIGGLISLARTGQATSWALSILVAGVVGAGLGQRLVSRAAELAPTLDQKVAILAVGAREATGNLILSGVMAGALVAGAALVARLKKSA